MANKKIINIALLVGMLFLVFPILVTMITPLGKLQELAIEGVKSCPQSAELLGDGIERKTIGFSCGSYETKGGFGNASWRFPIVGSKNHGVVKFHAENHGGIWGLTALWVEVEGEDHSILNCGSDPVGPLVTDDIPDTLVENAPEDRILFDDPALKTIKTTVNGKAVNTPYCSIENSNICLSLGYIYLRAMNGFKKDPQKAFFFLDKACEFQKKKQKINSNCIIAEQVYLNGQDIEPDKEKANYFKVKGSM